MSTSPTRTSRPGRYGAKASRFYEVNGEQYPSVTTILTAINKPALLNWAAKLERASVLKSVDAAYQDPGVGDVPSAAFMAAVEAKLGKGYEHQRELTKAGDIGTEMHASIEWTLKSDLGEAVGAQPPLSPPAAHAFGAWLNWRSDVELIPDVAEQVVYSANYRYAGTLDLLGLANLAPEGDAILFDWKTGKAIYEEALLQNAAYVHAALEMGIVTSPVNGCIVRLPKNETDPPFDPARDVRYIPWETQAELFRVFLAVLDVWRWLDAQK